MIATTTATGWGARRTCVEDCRHRRRCRRRRRRDCYLPTADGTACNDHDYYYDDDCRREVPPDNGRRTTSHSGRGGCRRHPPRAGCGAPVAVFAVAVRDGPPVSVGHAVAIAIRRPLLLLLHRCHRGRRLTIDAGDAVASGGTGLAPPASAATVAVIRHHRRVDRVEPLYPRHVGRGGNQYCFPLPPPLPLAAP